MGMAPKKPTQEEVVTKLRLVEVLVGHLMARVNLRSAHQGADLQLLARAIWPHSSRIRETKLTVNETTKSHILVLLYP